MANDKDFKVKNGLVVGGTTVTSDLTLNDSTPAITLNDTDHTSARGVITQASGQLKLRARDNTANGAIVLQADNGTTVTNTLSAKTTNQVRFDQYGSGTYTGTPAYSLAVDASGNIIEEASSAGGDVSKVGTPVDNQIGVWTGDGTIEGDSNFTWDGSDFVLNGQMTLNYTSTTEPTLSLVSTDSTADASPELELFKDSSTPADGDYLGQLKFAGENDSGTKKNFAKITGKVSDVTAGAEDGLIEFALQKAGSLNIGARLTHDALKLINGTALEVDGDVTATNGVISDGKGDVRLIPQNSQTAAYTLVAADAGKHVSITTGGVTVPASVFSVGDLVTIYNNSGVDQTISKGSTTLRFANDGTNANRTLGGYGICNILCVGTDTFVISGAGLS